MATKDPNRLFDLLDALRNNLESVVEDAKTLATEAGQFNGELNKVIKEQITKYFVPAIEKLINDDQTPGSVIGLEKFLGSVPLAMVREQPSEQDVPGNIMPEDVNLAAPAGMTGNGAAIDAIPQGASFAHPEGTAPVQESKETKFSGGPWKTEGQSKEPNEVGRVEYKTQDYTSNDMYFQEKFAVVRTSKVKPSGSDEFKEQCVAEFDDKEAAEDKAKVLNETVSPEEKEMFGTEYKVIESKGYPMQEAEGRGMKEVLDDMLAQVEEPVRESKRRGMKEALDAKRARKLREENLGKSMQEVLDAEIEAEKNAPVKESKKNKLSEAEVSSEEKKIFKNPFCKFKEVINSLKGYSKDEIDEELTAEIVADCFHWASAYRQYGGEEYESEIWDNWGDPIVKYILAHKEDLF